MTARAKVYFAPRTCLRYRQGHRVQNAAEHQGSDAGPDESGLSIAFDDELPINGRRAEIGAAIAAHQVVIVCGETGSGKTTQLPKICLALGRGRTGPDRPHAAAPDRRLERRAPHRAGTGHAAGPGGRLQGALHRPDAPRRAHQADDRRHPAGRNAYRSAVARLRHDHHRRGARTQPEHRFPARLPAPAAAAAPRPEGDRHVGHDRRRALRAALRARRRTGAGAARVGPPVSGRGALPSVRRHRRWRRAAGRPRAPPLRARRGPCRDRTRPNPRPRCRRSIDAVDELAAPAAATCWCSCPASARSARPAEALRKHHPPHTEILPLFARLSAEEQERVFRPSTRGASCWPRTSPRPR